MLRMLVAVALILLTMAAWPVLADNGQGDQGDKSSKKIAVDNKKSAVDKAPAADSRSAEAGKSSGELGKSSGEARPGKRKEAPVLIPEREAAALAFAQKYHADLGELLVYLKANNPSAYQHAVFDLYRTSQRLAMHHDRGDMDRYQLELKMWQAQSRSQLIVARMKMTATAQLEKQLRQALSEQLELRAEILRRDREKTADRLQKLDEQLTQLNKDREGEIQRQIDLLIRSAKNKTIADPPRSPKQTKASDQPRETSRPETTNP